MASSHHTAQPAGEPIEPDDDIPAELDNQQHYGDQRPPYWYRICPGGFLIPPPLPPSDEQHHGFPPAQGPPVDGGLVHAQPASGQHHQATRDGQTRGVSQEPAAWGSQTGVTNTHQSSEPTTASQGATTALRPNPEPQSPDRQRCEVWPLTYRTANGWFKVFWCVQIDGQSHYLDQPPDLQELSRRYHLVYFPDLASHDAQVNNQ